MKPESALWQKCKRNLNKITWSRIETVYTPGVPDLLGYHETCGFFTVELKVCAVTKSIKSEGACDLPTPDCVAYQQTITNVYLSRGPRSKTPKTL